MLGSGCEPTTEVSGARGPGPPNIVLYVIDTPPRPSIDFGSTVLSRRAMETSPRR